MAGAEIPQLNALTVDVEDYFHVQAFEGIFKEDDWDSYPSRVEINTNRILDLFGEAQVTGTFFVLGWVAKKYPALLDRMAREGHEVASHGLSHRRVDTQTPEEFRTDIRTAKAILEDAAGAPIRGYRAATFSIGPKTPWAYEILQDEGHQYSSSIYPINHDLYGAPDAERFVHSPQAGFKEVPITTLRAFGRNIPVGGGGYFRLLPYTASKMIISRVNKHEQSPSIFYFHPWEIDKDQPRVQQASRKSKFRHYLNIEKMEHRLKKLLQDFNWSRMDRVFDL